MCPFSGWTDMARVLPDLVRLAGHRSVYDLVRRHVRDPRLRVVLSFHPLLVGGNPFATTSIYSLIAFLERRWGVHFAMGGTGSLVRGLVGLIEGQGGTVRCDAEITRILVTNGRAVGVRLASGEEIAADVVVSNADSAWTYRHLVAPEERRRWTDKRIENARYSMSLFVWYFGTRRQYADVAHHTILLGPRYRELLRDIFERKVLAPDFSLYLHRPTATDPSLAPAGCDAFYVLSPVPHLDSGTDWPVMAEEYRSRIERRLERNAAAGAGAGDRHVAHADASGFPGPAAVVQGRRLRAGTRPDPERMVPSPQQERRGGPALSGRGRNPSGSGAAGRAFLGAGAGHGGAGCGRYRAPLTLPPAGGCCGGSRGLSTRHRCFCPHGCGDRPRRFTPSAGWRTTRSIARASRSAVERLDRLRVRLERIYAGRPLPLPVDRALADAVERFGIPKRILDALFEGFEWDIEGRRPADLGELHAYAARVAGTVGAMMAVLMGQRSADVVARACDLGVAMQLSNIARDVGEDARVGRLYLPLRLAAGGRHRSRRLAEGAGFHRGVWAASCCGCWMPPMSCTAAPTTASPDLPADCRPGISAARHLYAGIGHQVAARGGDLIASRAVVPPARKARLLGRALVAAAVNRDSRAGHAPLEATRFLVEAVASAGAAEAPPQASDQVIWLIMLFERLERGQRAALERHG